MEGRVKDEHYPSSHNMLSCHMIITRRIRYNIYVLFLTRIDRLKKWPPKIPAKKTTGGHNLWTFRYRTAEVLPRFCVHKKASREKAKGIKAATRIDLTNLSCCKFKVA